MVFRALVETLLLTFVPRGHVSPDCRATPRYWLGWYKLLWKDKIRWVSENYPTDLRGAVKQLLSDDGLTIGQVLYKGDREPYACKPRSSDSIDVLSRGFAL